ncbi:MAG: HlyD family type I secretion periplasmic adaptor subunit [Pseudomonadota bacterium]
MNSPVLKSATLARRRMRLSTSMGCLAVIAFFGVFGSWAYLASLASAAIAPGEVGFSADQTVVEHLEGGIVLEVQVADGDRVNAGQPLLRLDATRARSQNAQLEARLADLQATEARLRAERDEQDFDASVLGDSGDTLAAGTANETALANEAQLFRTRRNAWINQQSIVRQRINQLNAEISGLRREVYAQDTRLALLREEARNLADLFARKMVSKQRLTELELEIAEVEGLRARSDASIARARQAIAQEELQITELETARRREILDELRDVQATILDVKERREATADVLARTVVRAPVGGVIVGLTPYTTGSVIAPGQTLMEIVPDGETMLVRARVSPSDIDTVELGQAAFVRLTALSQRNQEPLEGRLVGLSANTLLDERSGEPYYLARVSLPAEYDQPVVAGMPAEVMISTGNRSPLSYLLEPLLSSIRHAWRES